MIRSTLIGSLLCLLVPGEDPQDSEPTSRPAAQSGSGGGDTQTLASGGTEDEADPGEADPQRIVWFTSWVEAKSEAARLNRPIFVQSAAPQCQGVPGMW